MKKATKKEAQVDADDTRPIKRKEQVQQSNDPHIDQDFPGFPHAPSERKHINPNTVVEKIVAGVIKKPHKKDFNSQ